MRTALYICYFSLGDPLTRAQVVAYLAGLRHMGFRVHLLTFEPHTVSESDRRTWRDALAEHGIEWSALAYHRRLTLLATLYDIARGAVWVVGYGRRHPLGLLHGRSHVGAAIARLARVFVRAPYIFDLRGLLAEEYADAGHWPRGGLRYRITRFAEQRLLRRADAVVVLTRALRDELLQAGIAGRDRRPLVVIPCAVDTTLYALAGAERERERQRRGWQGHRVIVYLGKLGGVYLVEELARFCAVVAALAPDALFRFATQSAPQALAAALTRAGLNAACYEIGQVPPLAVVPMLCAADAGVILYRPGASLRGRFPTKLGEYLAAGLPVASSPLAADCEELLARHHAGVILGSFTDVAMEAAARRLLDLAADPEARERCRAAAHEELSLSAVGVPRYATLYQQFLGQARADA